VTVDPKRQGSGQANKADVRRHLIKAAAGLAGLTLLASIVFGVLAATLQGREASSAETTVVKRGDMTVVVTEGGTLEAMERLEVKNETEGSQATEWKRAIAEVVDEGTVITEKDVEDGMVLVRFVSDDLEEREAQTQIWVYGLESSYTQARESYDIQKKQHESDVARAELNVRFSRLELERYLGADLAAQVLEEGVDPGALPDDAGLGGVAGQTLRQYGAQVELARAELSKAEEELGWARQLQEDKYITGTELTAAELAFSRRTRELEAAEEELRLFRRYTLPKGARRRESDHAESIRALERTEASGRGRLAQAEAEVKSAKASYELNLERLQKVRKTLENCTIRATKPGPVVYASTGQPWRDPIQVGTMLWQSQPILLIPDMSTLAARVYVHETDIEKVKLGQPAAVSVEALPGKRFTGKVARVSFVASMAQFWINPELRVYEVDVALDEKQEGLTPGMSATAEIVVATLKDVVQVPVEALADQSGHWVCSVARPEGPELRPIETGYVTENIVEVKQGLAPGEVVYLRPTVEPAEGPAAGNGGEPIPTAAVKRGAFTVTIGERGAVYSMKPLELKSEVEGWNYLREIVDEGTVVTEKDVEEGMVVARLETSQLEDQEADRQVNLYQAEAADVQARENLGIQEKQKESDMALAELNLEFAHLELQHYLGADLAAEALKEGVGLAALPDDPRLGGMARQELRRCESRVELAEEELLRAEERLRWSRQLCENEYVSRKELTTDELAVSRRKAELEAAKKELNLFRRYALPREVERRLGDRMELARELERVRARADSRLSQAESWLRSAEASLELQKDSLAKHRDKIAKCTIRARAAGQVIYGARTDPVWYRWGEMSLRPGVAIEERRTLIRIPGSSSLAALVNIPEAQIAKVEVGQPALISLMAVPDRTFPGHVSRVSPVASTIETYVESNAKVYETEVALDEAPERFIPGMSATVEIIAAHPENVLYVPWQAVKQYGGTWICWVKGAEGPELRVVQVGHRSDVYAEIESGLTVGELVYLAPPREPDETFLARLAPPEAPEQPPSDFPGP
jgi:HlyD family secretion protein